MGASDEPRTRLPPGSQHRLRRLLMRLGLVALPVWLCSSAARGAERPRWEQVKADVRARHPHVLQLSVSALSAWLQDAQRVPPLLLDTRSRDEFAVSHLEDAHLALSLDEALSVLARHPQSRQVVLYCSVGARSSAMAEQLNAELLRRRGAASAPPRVFNLEGSLFEWANAGLPLRDEFGPTTRVHHFNTHWGTLLNGPRVDAPR